MNRRPREARLHDAGLVDPATENIMITAPTRAQTASTVAALQREAGRLPSVATVAPPVTKAGGQTALVVVNLRGDPNDADRHVAPLERTVDAVRNAHPGVTVREFGGGSAGHAIDQAVDNGLHRAELISVPVTLLILVLAFGALVAASVPLLLGLTSVAAAVGAGSLVSHLVPMGNSTAPVVVLIGLAVGVDYSLFYIRRERAERRGGAGSEAALRAASTTVGRAIVVAGATVIIGLAGLLFSGFGVFTSMAVGAIIVVAIAVLGSVTVLPAVLALLGDRIDKGHIGRRRRRRLGPWRRLGSAGPRRHRPSAQRAGAGARAARRDRSADHPDAHRQSRRERSPGTQRARSSPSTRSSGPFPAPRTRPSSSSPAMGWRRHGREPRSRSWAARGSGSPPPPARCPSGWRATVRQRWSPSRSGMETARSLTGQSPSCGRSSSRPRPA